MKSISILKLNDNEIKIQMKQLDFNEAVNLISSAIYHISKETEKLAKNQEQAKEGIYTVWVQAFSLVMDQYFPEAKNFRKDIMTEEELQKLQDDISKQGWDKMPTLWIKNETSDCYEQGLLY